MQTPLTLTAVCGWALPVTWFRSRVKAYFPQSRIQVLYPEDPDDPEEAGRLLSRMPADLYLGYSLGSLWLMKHRNRLPPDRFRALLAPILAFPREKDMGGKTSETQLKYLVRKLSRTPKDPAVLMNFYSDCEVSIPPALLNQGPAPDVLLRGLEFLQTVSVSPRSANHFLALLGEKDAFLDPHHLKRRIPHLEIVPGAGHGPDKLLEQLSLRVQTCRSQGIP